MSEDERTTLGGFVTWMLAHEKTKLQQIYVDTFDMTPEHDLHLTHHLFGEDNGRGPALIDLGEHYKANGLEVKSREIPDYLPLILEYVSTLDEQLASDFLGDAGKVLIVLAENLEKANSPYSRLIRIIENRGQIAVAA
jgi:nitrate reductase delta subunit